MKIFNRKTYSFFVCFWIINKSIFTGMEINTSQNHDVFGNSQALCLCNHFVGIDNTSEKNQENSPKNTSRDIVIVKIQEELNKIWDYDKYNFKNIWNLVDKMLQDKLCPYINKMKEKQPNILKEYIKVDENEKIVLKKGKDLFGYERKVTKEEKILFYGHFSNGYEKFGIEMKETKGERTIYYGLWRNEAKILGIELKEKESFWGFWEEEKKYGVKVNAEKIEINFPGYELLSLSKKTSLDYRSYVSKEYAVLKPKENAKADAFLLATKLQYKIFGNTPYYTYNDTTWMRDIYFADNA